MIRSEQGSVSAEWAVATLAAIAAALMLCIAILSDWFEDQLYRPFEAALSFLF